MIGGFPNFSSDSPRKAPNKAAKVRSHNSALSTGAFPLATCRRGADGFVPTFITNAISTNQLPTPMPPERWCKASVESAPPPEGFPTPAPWKSARPPAHFLRFAGISIIRPFDFGFWTLDFGFFSPTHPSTTTAKQPATPNVVVDTPLQQPLSTHLPIAPEDPFPRPCNAAMAIVPSISRQFRS